MKNLPSDRMRKSYHNTQPPAVSVLMPCFNVERTLDEALASIFQQTFDDFEVIAVDDGSQDDTLSVLGRWAKDDARLKVVPRPHQGIIPALNQGLEHCQGKYVARMDGDDRSHESRFAKQFAYLEEHSDIAVVSCKVVGYPLDVVREGFKRYIEWLNSLLTPKDIAREIYIESPLAHPSVMMRKAWLEEMGGYQEMGWAEDYDLWLRLHLSGARFAKVPQALFFWREHPRRLTRTDRRYSVENFLRAKAHYLCQDLIPSRDAVILWGAGQMGRRLSKHLLRQDAPLVGFVDVDPKKIGRTLRGRPIIPRDKLSELWSQFERPVLFASVASRGARRKIRAYLQSIGLQEAQDWWAVA